MAQSTTIRISKEIYDTVKSIAQIHDQKIQDVIEQAIKEYKKKQFFDDVNNAYLRLKTDNVSWTEEEIDRQRWDLTGNDS